MYNECILYCISVMHVYRKYIIRVYSMYVPTYNKYLYYMYISITNVYLCLLALVTCIRAPPGNNSTSVCPPKDVSLLMVKVRVRSAISPS